jgi:antitoxin component YwqK of YwqJK toxin-antitoxin module
LGIAFAEIGWYRQDEYDYILSVEQTDSGEIRTLLHNGAQLRRWEIDPGEERIYGSSDLDQKLLYDRRGRLTEEQSYREGKVFRRTVYHYNREGLKSSETFDAGGRLLYRDQYRLSPDGQLRRVRRQQEGSGDGQQLALSSGSGTTSEERFGNDRQRRINRYDTLGRLVQQEHWVDGRLAERERFQYRDDSRIRLSSQLEEVSQQRLTRRSYDEQGELISLEISEQGEVRETIVHRRDDQGRIVETIKRGAEGIENWRFEYGSGDRPVREEYSLRGALQRITTRTPDESTEMRLEELFRDGLLFMRIYYEGERKVKEEFLSEGEILRVREYQ